MNQSEKVRNLCETALFIAIVFLGVFIIKIPGPFGYAHIGDSMIFLAVLMLGGKRGAVAGGLGAAIADVVSGYTIWALPTMVCKAAMALVMGALISKHIFGLKGRALWIVAALAGGLTQGVGYLFFWYVLFGKAAAIAAIPGLTFQAVVGIAIAFVISEALQKTALKKRFIYTTDGKGGAQTC
ncbi:MAG: ECF transporter S component [Eubacteriaceae bacterium]|nr:ECF transporter S component [Eubacteriaceae bacterium]